MPSRSPLILCFLHCLAGCSHTEARAPWAQERPPRGQTTEEAGARSAQQPQRLIPSSPAHPMCPSVPDWKACREREGPHRASPRARLKADAHTHTH